MEDYSQLGGVVLSGPGAKLWIGDQFVLTKVPVLFTVH